MFISATVSVSGTEDFILYLSDMAAFVYQFDYVFVNKSNRINSMFNSIITDESKWFVPIDPNKTK